MTARLVVKVVPRSKRTAVEGPRDGRVVVRVTAPPVDGAANDAAIQALADALRVPRRALRIISGETSRNKTIEVRSLDAGEINARLGLGAP